MTGGDMVQHKLAQFRRIVHNGGIQCCKRIVGGRKHGERFGRCDQLVFPDLVSNSTANFVITVLRNAETGFVYRIVRNGIVIRHLQTPRTNALLQQGLAVSGIFHCALLPLLLMKWKFPEAIYTPIVIILPYW